MKTFAELKTSAKSQIKGKVGKFFVTSLIVFAIVAISGFLPFVGSIASSVLGAIFTLGITFVTLKIAKEGDFSIGDVFYGFEDWWTAVKAHFFINLFVCLWSMLLIIPGIIKAYAYSMTFCILAENKGMPVLEAMTLSRNMMNGHKMEFFLLFLSFIGWSLLVFVTLGIAGIWVYPYISVTYVNFYLSVKEDYMAKLA